MNTKIIVLFVILGAALSQALPTIGNATCAVSKNDYTTYETCNRVLPPTPDNLLSSIKRMLWAITPPNDYVPYSCVFDADSMTGYGMVEVTSAKPAIKTVICNTAGCTSQLQKNQITPWLVKYAQGANVPCFYNSDNNNEVFFDTAGFCSYNGVVSNGACICNNGYVGDRCDDTDVAPGMGSGNSLIPAFVFIAMSAIIAMLL
eukprot:gene16147-19214_t